MLQRIHGALRAPENFVEEEPSLGTLAMLASGASFGIASYGGAVHASGGALAVASGALRALACAGGAWTLAIPALVVLSALTGSQVSWRRAVMASLLAVHFGGLAFLASIPVVALFQLTLPVDDARPWIEVLVVLGVGACSTLVFERTMARLEGRRWLHRVWMATFGVLFLEGAWLVDLFRIA